MKYYCPECETLVEETEMEDKDSPVCPECGSPDIRVADDVEPELKDEE